MQEILQQNRTSSKLVDNDAIDTENIRLLTKCISEHSEMALVVHHDVLVKGKTRQLRYHINMVEVACKVVGAYGTLDTNSQPKDVLTVDKEVSKLLSL